MQQTANYNLNLPEGTDVVNPLVDYNPNFSTIDSAMKANADRTVGRATCIKSGTTHVVTRSNTGSNIINFTATGDWNEGDTMTIDSTIVSVFLPDGTAALDGAYLINSEVFGILNGTRFTLYSNITEAETAAEVTFNNAASGLSATHVQGAIDEIVANMPALLGGVVKVTTASTPVNVTAGALTDAQIPIDNIPGYTCIGALGFTVYVSANADIAVQRVSPSSDGTLMIVSFVSNTAGSNRPVSVQLLYIKTDLIA